MSYDGTDNDGGGINNTGDDRHTDVNTPSENLLRESKRGNESATPPRVSTMPTLRMTGSEPGLSPATKNLLIGISAAIGLFVGLTATSLYYNGKLSDVKKAEIKAQTGLDACNEKTKRCVTELMGCASDVNSLTLKSADSNLTPRNFHVERSRKRKETVQSKYDEQLVDVLDKTGSLKCRNKQTFRKTMEPLQAEIKDLKTLTRKLKKANENYKAALIEASGGSAGASFQEAIDRNKARNKYLSDLNRAEAPAGS